MVKLSKLYDLIMNLASEYLYTVNLVPWLICHNSCHKVVKTMWLQPCYSLGNELTGDRLSEDMALYVIIHVTVTVLYILVIVMSLHFKYRKMKLQYSYESSFC